MCYTTQTFSEMLKTDLYDSISHAVTEKEIEIGPSTERYFIVTMVNQQVHMHVKKFGISPGWAA